MSVGSTVRTAREAAKMSIGDLSVKTRLRPALLSGIERDDFSACGGFVYARGHLRTIATLIGLDSTALIAEFDSTHAPIVDSLEESSKNFSEVNSHKNGLPLRKLSVVAGVLVVAALAWSASSGFHSSTPMKSASSIPEAVVSQPPPRVTATDPSAGAVAVKPNSVSVVITSSHGSSWLAATNSSGTQLFSSMLHRGQSKVFRDGQQIYLTIGNAGGVELKVNGKNLGVPGGDGQVVHLAFGPGSPTAG